MKKQKQKTTERRIYFVSLFLICISLFAFDKMSFSDPRTSTLTDPEPKEVIIQNQAFVPNLIVIKVNGMIKWTNKDEMDHTATSDAGAFDSQVIRADGGTFTYQFNVAGTFKYHCKFHPEMIATVIVR